MHLGSRHLTMCTGDASSFALTSCLLPSPVCPDFAFSTPGKLPILGGTPPCEQTFGTGRIIPAPRSDGG